MKPQFTWLSQCILILICGCASLNCLAYDFGVEPYLGYGQSTIKEEQFALANTDVAMAIGARGGWFLSKALYVALDYQIHGPILLSDYEYNLQNTMFGGGASITSGKIRLWAGYYFLDRFEDPNFGVQWNGYALKFAIGANYRPDVYFNVEYIQHFMQTKDFLGLEDETFSKDQFSASTMMLTMSALVELFGI